MLGFYISNKKEETLLKITKHLISTALLLLAVLFTPIRAEAAKLETIYNSPYVTFSPDGLAWTTNAGDRNYTSYELGTAVTSGISSSLRSVVTGEHYYGYSRSGTVPVGRWIVKWPHSHCIHNLRIPAPGYWHGISFVDSTCGGYYYSGWIAYCADCGEAIENFYVYMSREAAATIDYLEVGVTNGRQLDYYYLCPWNNNLEQGTSWIAHVCKDISWNQYKIYYDANAAQPYDGYMAPSIHMYNNADVYEGQTVTPATHLTKNVYTRVGYEFVGWNTRPDGSGDSYADGAEVLNLSIADCNNPETWVNEDNGEIILYAQWRPSRSTLRIDPDGGLFDGSAEVTVVEGDYGSTYDLGSSKVTPPAGYTVSFETNGGQTLESMTNTRHFSEWSQTQPFLGSLLNGSRYLFTAPDQNIDTVVANYGLDSITLPTPAKENSSFGGWYYDPDFTLPAGAGGDVIIPGRDMTLYAQWVELLLFAEDNYTANDGKGAVDLSWTQPDGLGKTYMLYQSPDGENWTRVNGATDISNSHKIDISFSYTGVEETYTVPYTGLYTITAQGAQGGGYESYRGGFGGQVTAKVWLQADEIITYNIGSQSGYNGGGKATAYGQGGGMTSVVSDQKGLLLVAGGGGGASPVGDGFAGGSLAGTVDTPTGESGMSAGGGGFHGGAAGALLRHSHVGCEYHVHSGSSTTYGDCYTQELGFNHTHNSGCYRTWVDDLCCSNCQQGPNAHFAGNPYGACTNFNPVWNRLTCTNKTGWNHTGWGLTCTKNIGWTCGMTENQIESSQPAYGGSNYVNTDYINSYTDTSGAASGDGSLAIQSEMIGFVEELSLEGVTAPDQAAPDMVAAETVRKEAMGGSRIKVTWEAPKDNGSIFYHVAESYLTGSTTVLCRSNITMNILTTGVIGYYTLVDEQESTTVTEANGLFSDQPEEDIILQETVQYLHIAAVDKAGNLSSTIHIPLKKSDAELLWPLYTEQLGIEEGQNIYPAGDKSYYVRSDGTTPFILDYRAYMDGTAREDYQINYAIFESSFQGNHVRNILECANSPVRAGSFRLSSESLTLTATGDSLLSGYPLTTAYREDEGRRLRTSQAFTLDRAAEGVRLELTPIAGAGCAEGIVYSDHDADRRNGLILIGDGTGPVISGLEALKEFSLIDRRETDLTLRVTAEDALSGVRDFYLEIYNSDNAVREIYMPEEDGAIRINITRDEPIFSGDFVVTAYAVDNVGNESSVSAGTTEFALAVEIERMLEPHDPVFKCGESGLLTITTWGYADRVEVEFPEEMLALDPNLNQVYVYTDIPAYRHDEKLQFMVPLSTPENQEYAITVRAYKGDRQLEEHPALGVISVTGSVLDEIRTRLR